MSLCGHLAFGYSDEEASVSRILDHPHAGPPCAADTASLPSQEVLAFHLRFAKRVPIFAQGVGRPYQSSKVNTALLLGQVSTGKSAQLLSLCSCSKLFCRMRSLELAGTAGLVVIIAVMGIIIFQSIHTGMPAISSGEMPLWSVKVKS